MSPLVRSVRIRVAAVLFAIGVTGVCGILAVKAFDILMALTYRSSPLRPLELALVVFDWYPFSVGHMAANMKWRDTRVGLMGYWFDGFDLEDPPVKAPNEYRIILIGGSGAQGQGPAGAANELMLYRQIEKHLNAYLTQSKRRYRVINLAMGGSRTYHNFVDLNLIGHKYAPDMIISYSGFNDWSLAHFFEHDRRLFSASEPPGVGGADGRGGGEAAAHFMPSLFELFPNIFRPDHSRRSTLNVDLRTASPFEVESFAASRTMTFRSKREFFDKWIVPQYVNALKSIKRDFPGIPIMLATQAIESIPDEFAQYGGRELGQDFYKEMIETVSKEIVNYIDDKWIFLDTHRMYEHDWRLFGLHLTLEAQEVVGDAIAQKIALYLDPDYAKAHPQVAEGLENGSYRVKAPKQIPGAPANWSEEAYLVANPDVAAAVHNGSLKSGYDHYLASGKFDGRNGTPETWDEVDYLRKNPDVLSAIVEGQFSCGYDHYLRAGRREGRKGGIPGAT